MSHNKQPGALPGVVAWVTEVRQMRVGRIGQAQEFVEIKGAAARRRANTTSLIFGEDDPMPPDNDLDGDVEVLEASEGEDTDIAEVIAC